MLLESRVRFIDTSSFALQSHDETTWPWNVWQRLVTITISVVHIGWTSHTQTKRTAIKTLKNVAAQQVVERLRSAGSLEARMRESLECSANGHEVGRHRLSEMKRACDRAEGQNAKATAATRAT